MLLKSVFHTDEHNHEHVPMTTAGMPYVCIHTEMDKFTDRKITWHWHNALEIVFIKEGTAQLRTPEQTILLSRGMACFVNTGVLHEYTSIGEEACSVYAHLFETQFLSGAYNSIFEEKYFAPICSTGIPQVWSIIPDNLRRIQIIQNLMEATELMRQEPDGYEFEVRSRLSSVWLDIFRETEDIRAKIPKRNMSDTERMKQMMDFIENHYMEEITAADIAASAGISTRESTRCFQRCIGASPIAYLSDYRIHIAAGMLRKKDRSVLEISEACGFSSQSYFSKAFRETFGTSPKTYQKNHG